MGEVDILQELMVQIGELIGDSHNGKADFEKVLAIGIKIGELRSYINNLHNENSELSKNQMPDN